MIDGWDVGLAILTPFLLALILYQGRFFYQVQQKRKYSFLNEFPYEMTQQIPPKMYQLFLVLGGLFSLSFMSLGFFLFPYPDVTMNLLLLISWGVTGVLLFGLFMIDMKIIKVHLMLDTLLIGVSVLNYVLLGTLFLLTPYGTYHIVYVIISYAFALFPLAIALNPKLKHWAKMDEQVTSQMEVVIVRPKFFVLAYSEWLLILSNMILMVYALIVQWIH